MSQIQRSDDVRTYFLERAQLFDALYEGDSALSRSFNRVFRSAMLVRYVYTLDALPALRGKRILDVGCGSARYAAELAKRGAHVTGIDFSAEMLAMARDRLRGTSEADRVELIAGDFVEWSKDRPREFDTALAMGVLDYVEDAPTFIARMAQVARQVIASFPRPTLVRMPLRKLRYALHQCPVHFYTRDQIEAMYRRAGLNHVTVKALGGAGYWVSGSPE